MVGIVMSCTSLTADCVRNYSEENSGNGNRMSHNKLPVLKLRDFNKIVNTNLSV
jgi:hypothetical protein